MKRSLWPSLIFAACGAGAAIWSTRGEKPPKETGQLWEDLKPEDLKMLKLESPRASATLLPIGTKAATVVTQETGLQPKLILSAGEPLAELYKRIAPVWANRVLGPIALLKPAEFGLDKADKVFTIALKDGRELHYIVGSRGFESNDNFILDKERGLVFLWDRKIISLLENAQERLAAADLKVLAPAGLTSLSVSAQGRSRTLAKHGNEWVETKEPRPLGSMSQILDLSARLSQLTIKGWDAPEALPVAAPLQLEVDGEYRGRLAVIDDAAQHRGKVILGEGKPTLILGESEVLGLFEGLKALK